VSEQRDTTGVREDVRALMAAARAVVDGYERHIARSLAQVRAMIREAERWTDEGGAVPASAQRYSGLAVAFDLPCRCAGRNVCRVCRALRCIEVEYTTAIEFEVAPLTAFRWMAGAQRSDLPSALAELGETLRRVSDHLGATEAIMSVAYAVAGCSENSRQVA